MIQLLLENQDVLSPMLRRDFLRILDYFRAVDTLKGRAETQFWIELGNATGVQEEELRKELVREREAEQGGLVGCSWLKCFMYEQEAANDTFMCCGCGKAMYCGASCQDR